MSLFKGKLDSANKFTVSDEVTGLEILKGLDGSNNALPAYLQMESAAGGDNFMWWDDSVNLRVDTSAPTNATKNSGGSVVTGASNAGANLVLSNLGTTTINASLISDTDSTDDLGSSAPKYWANAYLDKVLFNSTATMEGTTTAGVVTLVGNIIGGASGTGSSFKFFATTSGGYIHWDDTAAGNDGGLIFTTSASLLFGDASEFIIEWDGTNLTMDCKTDNTGVIAIGGTKDTDVLFNGATASSDVLWDASADSMIFYDAVNLKFGDESDFTVNWDASRLVLDNKTTDTGGVEIGRSVVTDVVFHGAGGNQDTFWDASANTLFILDNAILNVGTGADLALTSGGTQVTGTFSGTTGGLVLASYADQTTSVLKLDGATGDWDGADDVGMLWLTNDVAHVDAGASSLLIADSSTPINAAQGFMARFVHSGTAKASSWGVAIEVPATQGALWANGIVTITGQNSPGAYLVQITANDDTGNKGALDVHASGTDPAILVTGDETDTPGIEIVGPAAQTVPQLLLSGQTGAGWEGAANVGQLHIVNDAAFDDQGSALYIDLAEAPTAASEGAGIHVIQSAGSATTDGYLVNIEAVATGGGLHVDGGYSTFDEKVTFVAGSQNLAVALTATSAGVAIPVGTSVCLIDADSSAANRVLLPPPIQGNMIIFHTTSTDNFELSTNANTNFINGTECTGAPGSTKEMVVVDDEVTIAFCTVSGSAGKWVTFSIAANGVVTDGQSTVD